MAWSTSLRATRPYASSVPVTHPDAAGAALSAGRQMCGRFADLRLSAAIGISAGRVIAGDVGTAERHDYTVIGDPANEAVKRWG